VPGSRPGRPTKLAHEIVYYSGSYWTKDLRDLLNGTSTPA
jgi:hypothetical protein